METRLTTYGRVVFLSMADQNTLGHQTKESGAHTVKSRATKRRIALNSMGNLKFSTELEGLEEEINDAKHTSQMERHFLKKTPSPTVMKLENSRKKKLTNSEIFSIPLINPQVGVH